MTIQIDLSVPLTFLACALQRIGGGSTGRKKEVLPELGAFPQAPLPAYPSLFFAGRIILCYAAPYIMAFPLSCHWFC